MCGAFGFTASKGELKKRFRVDGDIPDIPRRYNIRPTQSAPIVHRISPNSVQLARFGLIPFWAKDEKIAYKTFNARVETVAEKPSYRKSLSLNRCIIPMTHFYEWQKTESGKTPMYIFLKDQPIFGVAGLYSDWKNPQGESVLTFTIITTTPNEFMAPIHDRMPAILYKEDEEEWLNPDETESKRVLPLLRQYPSDRMEAYAVSRRVNYPTYDDIELISPVETDEDTPATKEAA